MPFELLVVSNTPLTGVSDLEGVAVQFLTQVGYLPASSESGEATRDSVPYRLFVECFLKRPEKMWTVEELIAVLATSRPTVYRHLNKLKALDLLEEASAPQDGASEYGGRKTYRVRYGNLSKAWNFVEANVKVAMENYRKTVDHLHETASRAPATAKARGR